MRENYRIVHVIGRRQPFTIWYDRPGGDSEVVGFAVTRHLAERIVRDDKPDAPEI